MRNFTLSFFMLLLATMGFANTEVTPVAPPKEALSLEFLPQNVAPTVEAFLSLTPAKYKEITGENLGIKNTLKLKAAQKALKKRLKKNSSDISKGVYILLAIFGLGWLAMGLLTDFDGNDWLVNLLLTLLCWLPGLIHALVNIKKYYPS
ncbi:MAG: YqaE/Pmp3 family membrane protein [Bacteroidia bacterium]|nr:YqaE/Pmp3 family membrane protein [Bacteroidia bacterium]